MLFENRVISNKLDKKAVGYRIFELETRWRAQGTQESLCNILVQQVISSVAEEEEELCAQATITSLPSACFICRPYAADGVHSMLDDEPAIREILSKFQQVTVIDAQLNTLLWTFQTRSLSSTKRRLLVCFNRGSNRCGCVGLAFPNVDYVINFSFQYTAKDYAAQLNHAGRTTRKGIVHTFFTPAYQA